MAAVGSTIPAHMIKKSNTSVVFFTRMTHDILEVRRLCSTPSHDSVELRLEHDFTHIDPTDFFTRQQLRHTARNRQ